MALPADEERQRALAARLRELRESGFDRPLNRKELGIYLADVMRRPQGAYGARRIGDFEHPDAASPAPFEVLRGYAQLFGRWSPPPYDGPPSDEEARAMAALDGELRALREAIDAAPPSGGGRRRRIAVGALALVAVVALGGWALIVDREGDGRRPAPPAPTPCLRNLDNRPPDGAVPVICARDVLLRRAPGAAAIDTLRSGDRFEVGRYSSTGVWVQGTARFKDGRELEGWIEAGWFCPLGRRESQATACNTTTPQAP